MTLRVPLLIGISGKRMFDAKDGDEDRRLADDVWRRLDRVFTRLDEAFPSTPKILLTGAAFGADLLAAEAALARNKLAAAHGYLPSDTRGAPRSHSRLERHPVRSHPRRSDFFRNRRRRRGLFDRLHRLGGRDGLERL